MSSWYMPNEVALRIGLFNVAQPIGSMFAGIMQGAISETMHNHGGRSGWRWGFIINGVCTIFVALLAYFSIPGYPERPNRLAKWYLTDEDFAIARRRNARISRKPQVGITVKSFFRAFTFWQLWLIAFVWAFGYNTLPSTMYQVSLPCNGRLWC